MAVVAASIIHRPHRAASHVHAGTTTRSAGPSCRVSPFLAVATVMTDEGDFAHLDGVIQGGDALYSGNLLLSSYHSRHTIQMVLQLI